jgi:hypothetical protein
MPPTGIPQTAEQTRRARIVLAAAVIVMAVVLYFVLPRAFEAGRRSIDTPADAARQP